MEFLRSLGHILDLIGEYVRHILATTVSIFTRPPQWYLIRDQLYQIGVLSLGVVSLTGFFTGLVIATQTIYQLADKGLIGATGIMVIKAMVTELGPILTAFMVTGRVGAAITAQLGTMEVSEQVDALLSMSVNPLRYLVAPRFIAGIFMFPLLTIFCIFMGIFGGYLISVYFFKMAPATYFDPMPLYTTPFDFFVGMFKATFFAIIILTVTTFMGLKTTGGAEGVGKSTTGSVVLCYTLILFSNFFITIGLNLIHTEINRWLL
ncbi:MAG: Intermembrane phospholipid transport system permease protein MlaE [Chlamydiia bacterium]|nr:Intermembrane phospholipid transport system permease protein MlaE [Chlamydiia bacterium]